MSATNQFENDILGLVFTNVRARNIGTSEGLQPSSAAGSFHISLHTAALTDSTTAQNVSEANYTSYARASIARSTNAWTVTSGTVDNDSPIVFPTATGNPNDITHFGLGFAAVGAGYLSIYGVLTSSLTVSDGITPEFSAGSLDITLD